MTPRFSVLTPVHDPAAGIWERCVESVLSQTERDWEWCIVDDGSTRPDLRRSLESLVSRDGRVRMVRTEQAQGIVAATNLALEMASGEYVVLLDHDDELHPDALQTVRPLLAEPVDLVYTDEDIVDLDGSVVDPVRKPGWSPTRLRSQHYVNHLSVLRASTVREVGGFREGFDGSQDHDLVLRISERAKAIYHLPRALYRWRMAPESVLSQGLDAKPYAWEAGRRAVQEHCDRIGLDAEVVPHEVPGLARWYRLRHRLPRHPSVGLVVPVPSAPSCVPDDGEAALTRSLRAVASAREAAPMEIVVVAAEVVPHEMVSRAVSASGVPARIVTGPVGAGLGALRNAGAVSSDTELFCFMDPWVTVASDDWLTELVGPALEHDVGAVAGRLLLPGGVIASSGYALLGGRPAHLLRGLPATTTAYGGAGLVPGERSALPASLLLMRRGVFDAVGGFSPRYTHGCDDVDLSLKVRATGRRLVCTPFADAHVMESAQPPLAAGDLALLRRRWAHQLGGDPYINPAVRSEPWVTPLA